MSRYADFSPRAQAELDEQAEYIARQSPQAAARLIEAASETALVLARSPGLGRRWELPFSHFQGLRSFRVHGFPKHLLFYLPTPEGILVVRLLHSSRDLPKALREK